MISAETGAVMDWNAQIGRELRGLDGIVVTLLALAALAGRAAGAPYPIRCTVFWFLRQADAVATEFVAGSACGAARATWLAGRMTVRHDSRPGDEPDLALSLSRIARVVVDMARQLRRQAFLHRRRRSGAKNSDPRHGVPGGVEITMRVGRSDTS